MALRRRIILAHHLHRQNGIGKSTMTNQQNKRSSAFLKTEESMILSSIGLSTRKALNECATKVDWPLESRSNMDNTEPHGVSGIFALDGTPLDLTNLPPAQTVRWVMRRKVEVLTAVCCGLLNVDDACKRYEISIEEFFSWKRAMDRFGPMGLRASRLRPRYSRSKKGCRKREREIKPRLPPNLGSE